MDYLKQISIQLGGKIRSQNLSNWNYDEKSFRELVIRDYKGYKIEINEFKSIFEISINVCADFSFSINLPDKIFNYNTPANINRFPYKIYFETDDDQPHPLLYKEFPTLWIPFVEMMIELNLSQREGLFFYRNGIHFALTPNRDLISVLDDFVYLLNKYKGSFRKESKERIYAKNIPENLRPLIPLLKIWCIPDDSEREQLLEETSEKQKSKLLNTVRPFMVEINAFLDSFKDEPLSHEAMLLGNLAELISEIWVENP